MTILVTVKIAGDAKKAHQVLRDDPELDRAVRDALQKHGIVSTRRFVGDGEFLDIDEWETEQDRLDFLEDVAPYLKKWMDAMGATASESKVWRPAGPGEDL